MDTTIKIIEWVDVEAPVEEVFDLLAHSERRVQLCPSYGQTELSDISGDFPQEGSSYQENYKDGDELGY